MGQIFYKSISIGSVKGIIESSNNTLKIDKFSFLKDKIPLLSDLSLDDPSNLDNIIIGTIFDISSHDETCAHGDTVKLYKNCKITNYTNTITIDDIYVLQNINVSFENPV